MILQLLTLGAALDASYAAHGAENAARSNRSNSGSVLIPITSFTIDTRPVPGTWFKMKWTKIVSKQMIPSSKISRIKEDYDDSDKVKEAGLGKTNIKIETFDGETYWVEGSIEDFQNYLISLVKKPKKKKSKKKPR